MSAFSDHDVFVSAFARCFPLENDEGDAFSRKQKERRCVGTLAKPHKAGS